jgi:hypothetical protein
MDWLLSLGDALRLLRAYEREHQARLAWLRTVQYDRKAG